MISFNQLASLVGGAVLQHTHDATIETILTDSRKLVIHSGAIFFAIKGERFDGNSFVAEAYSKGIRQFVIQDTSSLNLANLSQANILFVQNSLVALQDIAAWHRRNHSALVIGITGSNAKTIIKEWLYHCLKDAYKVVKSPKSYNSQLGVALSVWQLQPHHDLAIFEAGISKAGEMPALENMIKPDIGIFTNIGSAHEEGFESIHQKIQEKLKLFISCKVLIFCAEHALIANALLGFKGQKLSWSKDGREAHIQYQIEHFSNHLVITTSYLGSEYKLNISNVDAASLENMLHIVSLLIHLNFSVDQIQSKINGISTVPMRLELKQGINQSYIVDDTYNNDLAGLKIALDFLSQQQIHSQKTVILSDILQSGESSFSVYQKVAALIKQNGIDRLIGIGTEISAHAELFPLSSVFYSSVGEFISQFRKDQFNREMILVKGARVFRFEDVVARLQAKTHGTVLEINLDAIAHNLNYYKSLLAPSTKIMVMVKSFAYGSGSHEVAGLLQYHKVDYLGVAYIDEAIELRQANIELPIMVMNPSVDSIDLLFEYKLEPEIFSLELLNQVITAANHRNRSIAVHIALDTGMHRLGFNPEDITLLLQTLNNCEHIKIASVFSHLVGADDHSHSEFTLNQIQIFTRFCSNLKSGLGVDFLMHICNSAGIVSYPEAHFDMVRLGVGLYGVEASGKNQSQLKTVSTLKSVISQVKNIKAGETIGYGRKGKVEVDSTIATIAIGYGDGYLRRFSNGIGKVRVKDTLVPIIGNVCMDMCMIDVSGLQVHPGDEVVIFGENPSIIDLATSINTIPYEILTNVSTRVKRIFYSE